MDIHIEPVSGIEGTFTPPGDKSISHRAVILAALARGTSRIRGFLEAEDTCKTIEALRGLGVSIQGGEGNYTVQGQGSLQEAHGVLDMGNSGTGFRLLAGVLAGEEGIYTVLTGDDSLRARPMERIILPLKEMGATIFGRENNTRPPVTILGERLTSIKYLLPIPSAQVKSALLLAALKVKGKVEIVEPIPCRDHTERMMGSFGVPLKKRGNSLILEGPALPQPFQITIPGDISSAAFLIVAALITPKSSLIIQGVGLNPTRSAFLEVLKKMGGKIMIKNSRMEGGEELGDVHVFGSKLQGTCIKGAIIPLLIDEIPALTAAAVLAKGDTHIQGAEELRFKESDRIKVLVQEFTALGASLEELDDGFIVKGKGELKGGARCQTHLDHRIGMALAIAGLASQEGVFICGGESIYSSFPDFFPVLQNLSIK